MNRLSLAPLGLTQEALTLRLLAQLHLGHPDGLRLKQSLKFIAHLKNSQRMVKDWKSLE